jgi:hypothetical protein
MLDCDAVLFGTNVPENSNNHFTPSSGPLQYPEEEATGLFSTFVI